MNIDLNRLSRDYSKFPIVRGEDIPRDDLKYLFFDLNLSRDEVASFLNISVTKVRKYLTKYGFKKTLEMQQDKVKLI